MITIPDVTPENDSILEFESLLGDKFGEARPGELIEGTIIKIGSDVVIIDIGYKSEGYIPLSQFQDREGKVKVSEGERVEVLMLSAESDTGEILLSRDRAEQLKTWLSLEEAFEKETTVEGEVVQKVKGGLQVDVGVPAFLPGSQIDIRPQRNLGKFIGDSMDFRILKICKERGNIVLSRRIVLEQQRDALKKDTIDQLSEGVVLEGVVKNVTDYGAFIDLGGIDGLLHITDMSWGRVNHPKEILTVGKSVPVVVLKYDRENERVSLGMKQLTENPWERVSEQYEVGATVKGNIVTLTDYGAFVKLDDGIEGLIHVSEMSWSKKVRNPSKLVSIGQEVEAVILEVCPENQRISLGLKQLTENPWDKISNEFPAGTQVKGKIRSIMDFGLFINVKDDIDGLVHLSDISWTKKIRNAKEIQDLYNKGDEVEAVVLEIDPENERLSLGIKQLTPDIWDTVPQRYPSGAKVQGTVASVTDFGLFLELEEGVEGLIHISQLDIERGGDVGAKYEIGTKIETIVVSVDKEERRISLSTKSQIPGSGKGRKEDYAQYMEDDGGATTFGDLIQQQLGSENDGENKS